MEILSTTLAVASLLFCLGATGYILYPAPDDCDRSRGSRPPGRRPGLLGLARDHYTVFLAFTRGFMNASAVTFGLVQVGYPLAASIAEGLTAGVLSAWAQVTRVNERYAVFLSSAPNEPQRMMRWAVIEALYYGGMKSAGALFGGGPENLASLVLLYVFTIAFATAQYAWVSAIASNRELMTELGQRSREQVRWITDLQMMAVSMTCVGVSAINSVGIANSRFVLVAMGIAGVLYGQVVRRRWAQALTVAPVVVRPDR